MRSPPGARHLYESFVVLYLVFPLSIDRQIRKDVTRQDRKTDSNGHQNVTNVFFHLKTTYKQKQFFQSYYRTEAGSFQKQEPYRRALCAIPAPLARGHRSTARSKDTDSRPFLQVSPPSDPSVFLLCRTHTCRRSRCPIQKACFPSFYTGRERALFRHYRAFSPFI